MQAAAVNQPRQKPIEAHLLDAAERMARNPQGRIALHIHLSKLQAEHRRDHHIRVASQTLENALKHADGQLFVLRNRDLVYLGRDIRHETVEDAVIRLRYLFADDPLIQFAEGTDHKDFCTWYNLERELAPFLMEVRRLHQVTDFHKPEERPIEKTPLTPAKLAQLETVLNNANVSALVRNQAICAVPPGSGPVPIFDEVFISIGELNKLVSGDIDLTVNRWLFLQLTQSLDKRLLAYLRKEVQHRDKPFSININVATLLSPEFMKFDEDLVGRLRGKLVIELQATDIFADIGSFMFARDYMKERGHRICLDGLTSMTLPFFANSGFGFDLVKLFWSPRLVGNGTPEEHAQAKAHIASFGQSRTILARVDNQEAIDLGRSLGIDLFQGFHIDNELRSGGALRA